MSLLAGPVFAVAGVLAIAGVLKLAHPATTARALDAARLPGSTMAVRALALTEIVVGVAAIAFGTPVTAAALMVYFLAFAGFTALLIRRAGSKAPCGCFGETATAAPPTTIHVTLNLIAAALAAAAVIWPTGGIVEVMQAQPLAGIPFLVLTVLCGWLWYLGLTVFPELVHAMQPIEEQTTTTASRS
jgi:hypothetical protein